MPSTPFTTDNAALAFNHFSPIVAVIPADELPTWPGSADIIRINVDRVVERIGPQLADIVKTRLPAVSEAEIREMPSLALALTYAADRVIPPASPEVRKRQQAIRPLRRFTLMQLQIFAFQGLVPEARTQAIMANQGPIDEANDCIAIPEVFREYEAQIAGKHPFTAAQLDELSNTGNWLKAHLNIPGATPGDEAPVDPDALIRDQLYADLRRRYDDAYKVGVEIWGRTKVDENLPALLARVRSAPKPKEPVAPTDTAKEVPRGPGGTGTSTGGAPAKDPTK